MAELVDAPDLGSGGATPRGGSSPPSRTKKFLTKIPMKKISVKGLALGLGITWASGVFLAGILAPFGFAKGFVNVVSSVYLGYKPGLVGALIGGGWAFIDGAIGGAMIAFIYNWVVSRSLAEDGEEA